VVEYALVIAGTSLTSLSSIGTAVGDWVSNLDWTALSYAALGLVALRIAFWAFRSES
jgi:hypothetical protein